MKIFRIFTACLILVPLAATQAIADDVCSAAEKAQGEAHVKRAEDAERAGRTREAYDVALNASPAGCASKGPVRINEVLYRTSVKLGNEAEKAGRYKDAFDFFRAPQHRRAHHDLADADRALLKHVKASPGDYKTVRDGAQWFDRRGNAASLKETRAIAKAGGEKALAAEEKAFAASRASLNELQQARDWFDIVGEAKRAVARAEQRGDALLAHGTFSAVEQAFRYYDFAENQQKLGSARDRARKIGDEHAGKGQTRVAAQFYDLAGDTAKSGAMQRRMDAQAEKNEKAEGKRQDQFKKDKQSLEKALGL